MNCKKKTVVLSLSEVRDIVTMGYAWRREKSFQNGCGKCNSELEFIDVLSDLYYQAENGNDSAAYYYEQLDRINKLLGDLEYFLYETEV